MLRAAKIVLGSLWIVVVFSIFALFMACAVYFAWEEGWFHFAFSAFILAIVAFVVAGAVNYWSEHR